MMTSEQNQLAKRFKKLSKKKPTTLTFLEKTSKISAKDAVNTLLDRSHNENDESFEDIISAFSNEQIHCKNGIKSKRKRSSNCNTSKKTENIEYLNKTKLESSSNLNKRSFSRMNDSENVSLSMEPPKKKQKEEINNYYLNHWNIRYENRENDIYPIIKQRQSSIMKKMDLPQWFLNIRNKNNNYNDYCCFIDSDCKSFEISRDINNKLLNCPNDMISSYNIRREQWLKSNKKWNKRSLIKNNLNRLSPIDSVLFSCLSTYRDLFFCGRNWKNDKNIKQILTMHFISHILRNQEIKISNDLKLESLESLQSEKNEYRDCGFKRLSVLIITPFRCNVYKFGEYILLNLPKQRKLKNQRYKKFVNEYGEGYNKQNGPKGRGLDFEHTFFGNIDDDFWCGISIDKKGVNFLQNWYYSDIIFISPLRLKLIFESGKTSDGRSVYDFFSSIEIMIIDQCDIIEMQNINHLFDTIHKINWHPKLQKSDDIKSVNFDRLRYCYIDDVSQFYRQNIIISSYQTPKIKQLFQQRCLNIFGRIKIDMKYNGILEKVIPFIRQQFYRFDLIESDINDIHELRLNIYKKYILPIFRKNKGIKTLIFISSYYDFLRLRRLYKNVNNIRFLSEYTTKSDSNKYRREFLDETNENIMYLVITERYYFYQRIKCLGAQRILFYNLPIHKEYYYQILNWFDTKKQYNSYALYCKNYDNLALQRIVGIKRMIKMLKNTNNTQVFV